MYAAMQGKQRAIALNDVLLEMSLLDFFCNAFGDHLLTFEEKLEIFYFSLSIARARGTVRNLGYWDPNIQL